MRAAPLLQPNHFAKTSSERLEFAQRCFDCLKDSGSYKSNGPNAYRQYLRQVIERWFFGTSIQEIKYENFAMWVCWAFIGKDYSKICNRDRADVVEIIDHVEKLIDYSFAPGFNSTIRSARYSLN